MPDIRELMTDLSSPALRAIVGHWEAARGERPMPEWADLSSTALAPHFQLLWGFRYDAQTEDFIGTLAGRHVKDWLGANYWGASLREIHPPEIFSKAQEFLTRVVKAPAAGRANGRLFTVGDMTVTGERIALPIASDGVHADAVLGASYYEPVAATGPVRLIHENCQWFSI